MASLNYGTPVELFSRGNSKAKGGITSLRFVTAADAIRYAVEIIPAKYFVGTFLEANDERFDCNAIRRLYDSAAYPLSRQPAAIQDRLLLARRA
jgi:hypothetical protein